MVNPFDRTFFRSVLGFALILSLSFAIFFFIGKYRFDSQALSAKTDKTTASQTQTNSVNVTSKAVVTPSKLKTK